MPTLRKNPITNEWVIIATERAKRPVEYKVERRSLATSFCPFCAGNEEATPPAIRTYRHHGDTASQGPWSVRVVPNKYPALRVEGSLDRRGEGIYDLMEGVGAHEVIIEAPSHVTELSALGVAQITTVLWAWRDRIVDLRNDSRLKCAVVFKNHGAEAGASVEHAHSQLIALPVVPKRLREELDGARRYYDFRERCAYCDIISQEVETGKRVVFENADVVAIAPFASRFPFEIWFLPRRHEAAFERGDQRVFESMAEALRTVMRKLDVALNKPAFNLMLHSSPFGMEDSAFFHWHFELIPKLNRVAGFEWGTGFHINPTPSETAARHLREIVLR